ncbi:DUF6126 family protein [Streptomyces sp. NPDC001795]|uniref:DUF6126 family protein n=1 Tax=Streptomyces sp. NPDC001795 TaxID=3154525 RepID=UPI00332DEB4E
MPAADYDGDVSAEPAVDHDGKVVLVRFGMASQGVDTSGERRKQEDDTVTAQASDPTAGKQRKQKAKDREWRIECGVAIRAGFHIFGTHPFAGFVRLLFRLGEHAHKGPACWCELECQGPTGPDTGPVGP